MRTFWLDRVVDESGVSGTGRVAQGVQFDDGVCVLRWLSAHKSTAVYNSMADLEHIHSHGGSTIISWADAPSTLMQIPKPHLAVGIEEWDLEAEYNAILHNIAPGKLKSRLAYDRISTIQVPPGWRGHAGWTVSGDVYLNLVGPSRFLYAELKEDAYELMHYERECVALCVSADGVVLLKDSYRPSPSLESYVMVGDQKFNIRKETYSVVQRRKKD